MIRPICALVAVGLLLGACSSDDKKGQGTAGCGAGCGAGEVCRSDECRAVCSRELPCDEGNVCRQGACFPIVCGDGEEDGDEECDNGERNADDASCTTECVVATCGDSLVWDGREECDEGRGNDNDGSCTERCTQARCGDGLIWKDEEECDDGLANRDDGACTSECAEARCGDGLVWAGHEECDDGNETLDDTCPDGPGGTCRWNLPPAAATALAWQQGSHTNSTTPVATWTPSSAPGIVAQELQLYADDDCGTRSGAIVPLATSTGSRAVPVTEEGTYTFRIIVRDDEQREAASDCSPPVVVDTTPPEPATDLGFVETSPHEGLTVHGTWTLSSSEDLAGQSLQLYGGGACASVSGTPVDVGSATAEQYPIVTPTNATYSFKVISRDLAGNTATSACSPAMQTSAGAPYQAKFSGELPQTVVQVRIDPKNAAVLYASLANGEIRKSVNSGATWTSQCVSSNIAEGGFGRIRVSPDGTAYASGHTQFVRVEALNGGECPVAIGGSAAWASYYHSNRLAIDSTGKLYTWTFTDPAGLVSSTTKGASYEVINSTPSLFNSMEVDPFDDKHLVAVFSQHSTSPVGIQHSLDSGKTWTQTDAAFTDYEAGIRFNPAAKGWIHLGGGRYSKDGGLTWATNQSFACSDIDATGAGYRLVSSGGSTSLERAPDMTNPVWSTLHTFTGVSANLGVSMVSVVGSTIAVVLEGRLYVSTNSGGSFSPLKLVVKDGPLVVSSMVAHGSTVYAAVSGHIVKSTDGAGSWTDVYSPSEPLHRDTELHLNPAVPAQVIARVESWNSTYERRLDVTLDGGASWSTPADCCYSWAGVLALGAADAGRVLYFGFEPRISNNGGLSFTEASGSGQLVWYPWPAAFVSPSDANRAWFGDDSGRLYEYAAQTGNDTNITSRLPFSNPAGMDLVKVGNAWQLRIVSRTGQIATSQNGGASFTLVAGSGGLPSSERRVLVSHPDTPSLIATADLLGQDVAYSPTLGATWVQTTLEDCEVRGLALTDGELLIPCSNSPAMGLATP